MEESLSKRLISTREAARITVDDVVYRAKIPRAVIEALEAEDLGFFTSPLYARSFLKQYSEYIGADVEPWINDLIPDPMIDGAVESFIDCSDTTTKTASQERQPRESSGVSGIVLMVLVPIGLMWAGVEIYETLKERAKQSEESAVEIQKAPEVEQTNIKEEISDNSKKTTDYNIPAEAPQRAIIVELPGE